MLIRGRFWGIFTILFCLLGTPGSYASVVKIAGAQIAGAQIAGSQVAGLNTLTSAIVVSGKMASTTRSVWIQIIKGTDSENIFPPLNQQSGFSQKVYLHFGPGTYEIKVLESTGSDPYQAGTQFYEVNHYSVENNDPVDRSFLLPSFLVQSDDQVMINLANAITERFSDPLAKTQAIHDYVAANIAYDVLAPHTGNTKTYSAFYTLSTGRATCYGYTHLTAALNRAIGLRAKVVEGYALAADGTQGLHAWNEVFINGRWVVQDTTWDSGSVSAETQTFRFSLSEKYFNPDPQVFSLDHGEPIIMKNE